MADLEFLRNSPQFQNLRQMVQAQPHLLPTLLQQIGQTNPQLLQVEKIKTIADFIDDYSKPRSIFKYVD